MDSWARRCHAVTATVTIVALVLQLGLVLTGAAVLVEGQPPDVWTRLGRLVSYFTIQSNLLVAVSTVPLAINASWDGRRWRAVRVAGLVGITVTGLVHFVLLRPLLDLDGLSWVADKLLHMVVPALAIAGWLAFGPRPRVSTRAIAWALGWPLAWLTWTLAVGEVTGWFPYPFLDHRSEGWGRVAIASVGITVLFVALLAAVRRLDDRRQVPRVTSRSG